MNINIILICWPGVEENVEHIASEITGAGWSVTVIYSESNDDNKLMPKGPGTWIKTPDSWYYGSKLNFILNNFSAEVLLQIHGDVHCLAWPNLVSHCLESFDKIPHLKIWSPNVEGTFWTSDRVSLSEFVCDDRHYLNITNTDTMVWGLSRDTQDFLKSTSLTKNNLGWGVDWAACAYAYYHRSKVLRDLSITVNHPLKTGYNIQSALFQESRYLSELPAEYRAILDLIQLFSRKSM